MRGFQVPKNGNPLMNSFLRIFKHIGVQTCFSFLLWAGLHGFPTLWERELVPGSEFFRIEIRTGFRMPGMGIRTGFVKMKYLIPNG